MDGTLTPSALSCPIMENSVHFSWTQCFRDHEEKVPEITFSDESLSGPLDISAV